MMDIRSLLLLLHCTAVTVSQSCSDGAVEIFGVETDILIAGRLEICVDGQWFAVYAGGWGNNEAQVVCREKGFGYAEACSGSCFGASELTQGYESFQCTGDENALINCSEDRTDSPRREEQRESNAGVICRRPQGQATSQCHIIPAQDNIITTLTTTPDMTTPPDCVPTIPDSTTNEQEDTESDNMTLEDRKRLIAVIAILGVLSAIMFFTLVGMVMGWVWSCYRTRPVFKEMVPRPSYISTSLTSGDAPSSLPKEMEPNPCYAPTSLPKEMEPNPCYAPTSLPKEMEPNPCYAPTSLPKEIGAQPLLRTFIT